MTGCKFAAAMSGVRVLTPLVVHRLHVQLDCMHEEMAEQLELIAAHSTESMHAKVAEMQELILPQ